MDVENINSNSGEESQITIESVGTSNTFAKLRRLKIQESIITASLEKSNIDQDYHTAIDSNRNLNWKIYSAKVKSNINEIKDIFEDIKVATCDAEDNLKDINIEEIKKDILNLNGKIKSLEDFISAELTSLKSEEKELIRQMNEEPKQEVKTKEIVKIQNKQYNEVVPSPVRVLINSPLKCAEVQQFQEFMSKSKNRYGGWNEYNHHKFIQIWNKFYDTDDVMRLKSIMKEISCNKLLPQFTDEVYEKIPGIKFDDIILHSKWFSEFCYLKRAQQAALDKWRENKRKIKGQQGKVKGNKRILQNSNNDKLCRKQNESYKHQQTLPKGLLEDHGFQQNQSGLGGSNTASEYSLHMKEKKYSIVRKGDNTTFTESRELIIPSLKSSSFAMPTEQWINRCDGGREAPRHFNSNIENVHKLCIPFWRMNLHKDYGIQ